MGPDYLAGLSCSDDMVWYLDLVECLNLAVAVMLNQLVTYYSYSLGFEPALSSQCDGSRGFLASHRHSGAGCKAPVNLVMVVGT